jgi:hypothetical protein
MTPFTERLVLTALAEVGVKETGTTNRGPRVDEYQRATWLDQKDWGAWCAAFVCWVVRASMNLEKIKETDGFHRPQTAGAWDFERWSLEQDNTTQTAKPAGASIKRGDIVIFTFSHIGIATSAPDAEGNFHTVEGNSNSAGSRTGGMVCTNIRNTKLVRSRIRFTI